MINLGDKVRDTVTELEGIVVGKVKWLHGCDQVVIRPQGLHDGKPIPTAWADVNQLKVLKAGAHAPTKKHDAKPGGPSHNIPAASR